MGENEEKFQNLAENEEKFQNLAINWLNQLAMQEIRKRNNI